VRRWARAAALAVAAAGIAPSPAPAATATVVGVQESPSAPSRGVVSYRAAPGEANRFTVLPVPGQPHVVELREATVVIAPGPGCVTLEPVAVRCDGRAALSAFGRPSAELQGVVARLGDGADEATSRFDAAGVELRGAAGADRLVGGDANEVLRGGAGDDVLRAGGGGDVAAGGPGRDRVVAGAGDDVVEEDDEGGRPGRDTLDGGPGTDKLAYRGRRRGVTVDLARRRGAEGDMLRGMENVGGGQGDDVLRGSSGRNELRGGDGNDRLQGRGGRDVLFGDEGRDALSGGAGRDDLDLADGVRDGPEAERDRARCGTGADIVRGVFPADRLAADCERALVEGEAPDFFSVLVSQPLRARRGGTVSIRLADAGGDAPFRGRVALRFNGLLLGRPSRAVALRRGGRATARVRLVSAALARLRESRRLTVEVLVGDASFTTTLRAPLPARGVGGGTPA
jgi:hypothetical protein